MPITYYLYRSTLVANGFLLLSFLPAYAQHTAALKAPTFRIFSGLVTVAYEQALNKHLSADFSLQGGNYIKERLNQFEDFRVRGIGTIGALRYYPFTKKVNAPRGFFAYAALRYIRFQESFLYIASGDRYQDGGNMINLGGGIGYKFAYRRIGLEAFGGWGAGHTWSDDDAYHKNIPEFYRRSMEWAEEDFAQLDVALCYMFSRFSKD